eukprot:6202097-Pleurochrysis_carterae.AAC.1
MECLPSTLQNTGSELARGGDHTNGTRPGRASLIPLQRFGETIIDIGPSQRRQGRYTKVRMC